MLFPRLARCKDVVSNFSLIKITYVFGKHLENEERGSYRTLHNSHYSLCIAFYHSDRATSSEGRVGKATTVGPLKT